MSRTPQGITVQGSHLPQHPTLSNMTQSELNFALLVEEMLNHIQKPEYRQTVVEVSTFYKFLPEVFVKGFILRQHSRTLRYISGIRDVRQMELAQDYVQ
jgi:GTPase SAR1 family protein